MKKANLQYHAKDIILEMVSGGATKVAIAKAVGVTDMTILSVSRGKTKTFRKMKKLQRLYDRWKAGSLDLSGRRGRKGGVAAVDEKSQDAKKDPAGKKAPLRKLKVANKRVPAERAKKNVRPTEAGVFAASTGFELPYVTEEMVADVEEQIRRLQAQAGFMRDLIAIRKKYGQ